MPEVGGGVEKGKGVQPLDDPHNRNGGKVLTPCDWSVATPFTHTDPCAANAPVPFFLPLRNPTAVARRFPPYRECTYPVK